MSYRTVISSLPDTPAGWSIKSLSDVAAMKSGDAITSTGIQELGSYPVYGGNGLRGYCEAFNRDGDCSLIGRQGALCGAVHHTTGKIFASEHAIVCKALGGASQRFITYVLHALELNALSEASAQPGLSVEKLRKLSILLPDDPKEQEAIAEALSDADALIEGLERLIAKKRLIKQGTMQDLLTAKRRLWGFSGEWRPCKLGERGQFFKGAGVRKDEAVSGQMPCVRYGELYTLHHDVVRSFASFISTDVAKTARAIKSGDILFAGSGETKEEIGKCAVVTFDGEVYAGGDIIAFRPSDDDPVFMAYLLNSPDVQKQKARRGQGDAVVHISATALADLNIRLPSKNEQDAISVVLEDMDAEIQALEARLEKARQVKEGMMQNLLTGRIRLV